MNYSCFIVRLISEPVQTNLDNRISFVEAMVTFHSAKKKKLMKK